MNIKRTQIEIAIEKQILYATITSFQFLRDIHPSFDPVYIQNSQIKKILNWCIAHYEYYEETAADILQDIFNRESSNLEEAEVKIIEDLLSEVSTKYEHKEQVNVEYLVDQVMLYFRQRELEITASNIQVLVKKGDINGAEEQIVNYRKVAKVTHSSIDLKNDDSIAALFKSKERPFFQLTGKLGQLVGPMEKGHFVAIAGAFKSGKSWFLQEIGIEGILNRLKVVEFSLEMMEMNKRDRIYKRLVSADSRESKWYRYPVFDCTYNQDGSCEQGERTNNIRLLDNVDTIPPFNHNMEYRPCTWCKDNDSRSYSIDTWWEESERPPYDFIQVTKTIKAIPLDNYRIKVFPRFSANFSDIERELDMFEYIDGFIPDIILIDYLDILAPESRKKDSIEEADETWKAAARLAGKRKSLVISVTQLNREADEKAHIKRSHMAGWIGRLGHVDKMIKLAQIPSDVKRGILRVGKMVDRHEEVDETLYCWVLQNLKLGQFHLDSEIAYPRRE
uniref:Putative helicase n=1 Tax=viral metagenome TaxID=1070528 RepID=A0A6M3IRX5_9ZZZZ